MERHATTKILQQAAMCEQHVLVELYAEVCRAYDAPSRDVARCIDHIGSLRFTDWDLVKQGVGLAVNS